MFLDMVKGLTFKLPRIASRSKGEKSPSGPIKTHKDLLPCKSSIFKLSCELTSAKRSLVDSSNFFKKSFNLITSVISGGTSWLDCSVASIVIFFALSWFNSFTSVLSEMIGIILLTPSSVAFWRIVSIGFFFTKQTASSILDWLFADFTCFKNFTSTRSFSKKIISLFHSPVLLKKLIFEPRFSLITFII